jgi:hypothetical protein
MHGDVAATTANHVDVARYLHHVDVLCRGGGSCWRATSRAAVLRLCIGQRYARQHEDQRKTAARWRAIQARPTGGATFLEHAFEPSIRHFAGVVAGGIACSICFNFAWYSGYIASAPARVASNGR